MNDAFGTSDDLIPDFDWDGTGTTEDDLKDSGGFVSKRGYYHLDLRDVVLIRKVDESGQPTEPAHVRTMWVAEAGEHQDQVGKQVSHRLYLQKWEYQTDEKGNPLKEEKTRNDGSTYEAKVKTGRILKLEPSDFQTRGAIRFFIGLGLLSADVVGRNFKLPTSKLIPGLQCVAMVGNDGQIEFNKTYQLDSEDVANVPKNQELLTRWQAGTGSVGVNDDVINAI